MSSRGLAAAREQGFADLLGRVETGVTNAADALARLQQPDGHWAFELEADATIPAEYVLLRHFLGEPDDPVLEAKIVRYLWSIQGEHGGWPLFHGGDFNMSASVKAYYALKICGEHVNAPVMKRAREAILSRGGAKESNVFTLAQLALYGQVPWRAVPVMPVEIMALPRWFPFHLDKVSYWSRTVIVPLLVLMAKRPLARNPRKVDVRELFVTPPEQVKDWYNYNRKGAWASFFRGVDRILHRTQGLFPKKLRERCIADAVTWVTERLNGEDGLGAIYPAMANSVMMYDTLGYPEDHPDRATARGSLEKLMVLKDGMAYCQPCLSPVWDTALAAHAMMEAGGEAAERVKPAMDWLRDRQILDVYGDWAVNAPGVRPGGWAFQYNNAYYPDVDDTAAVVLIMDRTDRECYRESIDRATEWIFGLQSKNGGWGAFDANNDYYYLNHIPFADHGALLDPPT
ncbi:MAG TPA: squalene--hopene cyclase, partial [Dongiaceae bacterium]|nr:squalene--hopene cyclase [Dongiaceae bacterium]